MIEKSISATSLDELRPAEVLSKHRFELDDTDPISHSANRMAPLHIELCVKSLAECSKQV